MKRLVAIFTIATVFTAWTFEVFARELSEAEKSVISEAVLDSLKDPESARFAWPPYRDGSDLYCGYVNAKNSFGGYVGDARFSAFVVPIDGEIKISQPIEFATGNPSDPASRAVEVACAKEGY
jgi:hypothetical protein